MSAPGTEWTNTRLVEECLRGNEQAWNVLVDRYKGLVYSIPFRYGALQQDAADIFQAVCLDLFNELPRLRDAEAIQGWLVRVTTHKCYRWKREQPMLTDGWDARESEPASPDGLPPDLMAELEKEHMIRAALEELPPRCRHMIELLFFEQPPLPYDEVARRLRLAKGSIGFIRGRCLKRLKDILETKGF
ncbi:MAG TPA: sigma-70 family RNA polymerase sigma factor [Candidatus Sulfopaludibacter sp.]|jgi:RNA polymerase sigma factor (sigma-70 family)|nr:sigma-70 family RNA polymerase sigma factor [Candidatus Sulfopaludibacter sp.]